MLTVAVCDLFFVLHFATFGPSQLLGLHSYGRYRTPATARFGMYGCLLPTIHLGYCPRQMLWVQINWVSGVCSPVPDPVPCPPPSNIYAMQYEPGMNNKAFRPCGRQVQQCDASTLWRAWCGGCDGPRSAASRVNDCICTLICTGATRLFLPAGLPLSRAVMIDSLGTHLRWHQTPALRIQWTARFYLHHLS